MNIIVFIQIIMTKRIEFIVIRNDLAHEKDKKLCFDFECEPLDDQLEKLLYTRLYPEEPTYVDNMHALMDRQDKIRSLSTYLNDHSSWCAKCHMFARPSDMISNPDIIEASKSIRHMSLDPIWQSNWNIALLYLGRSTLFTQKFNKHHGFKEVTETDLNYGLQVMDRLGEPRTSYDLSAFEETKMTLSFIDAWLKRDVHILTTWDFI